jgi:hypothetical protein
MWGVRIILKNGYRMMRVDWYGVEGCDETYLEEKRFRWCCVKNRLLFVIPRGQLNPRNWDAGGVQNSTWVDGWSYQEDKERIGTYCNCLFISRYPLFWICHHLSEIPNNQSQSQSHFILETWDLLFSEIPQSSRSQRTRSSIYRSITCPNICQTL